MIQEIDQQSYPLTSRLKRPTSLSRPDTARQMSTQRASEGNLGLKSILKSIPEHKYAPKINKNTDKLLQKRDARIQQMQKSPPTTNPQKEEINKVKPTDKYLIQRFNKDFDTVHEALVDNNQSIYEEIEPEQQQFSPSNARGSKYEKKNGGG